MTEKSRVVFFSGSEEALFHILDQDIVRKNLENYFNYTLYVKIKFMNGEIEQQKINNQCDLLLLHLGETNKTRKTRQAFRLIKKF